MISNTKRVLKSVGYLTMAFLTASLAKTQSGNELFMVFSLASGISAAGASCCLIAAWEDVKEKKQRDLEKMKELKSVEQNATRSSHVLQRDPTLPEQDAQQSKEDSSPTTPEA